MQSLQVDRLLEDLRSRIAPRELRGDIFGGVEPRGWPDETWVLHPMWELEEGADVRTYNEVFKADVIASIPTDNVFDYLRTMTRRPETVLTGVRMGSHKEPTEDGWRRLPWQRFLERVGHTADAPHEIPGQRWFTFDSWPVSILSPCEGSMDYATTLWMISLILEQIPAFRSEDPDSAYSMPLNVLYAGEIAPDHQATALRCEIREVPDTMERVYPSGGAYTPTNIGPLDCSWMTWTPTQGMSTKVCGSREFVESVRGCGYFETAQIDLE